MPLSHDDVQIAIGAFSSDRACREKLNADSTILTCTHRRKSDTK